MKAAGIAAGMMLLCIEGQAPCERCRTCELPLRLRGVQAVAELGGVIGCTTHVFLLPLKALKSNLRVPVEEGGGREKEEQRIQKERACIMQYKLRNTQKH